MRKKYPFLINIKITDCRFDLLKNRSAHKSAYTMYPFKKILPYTDQNWLRFYQTSTHSQFKKKKKQVIIRLNNTNNLFRFSFLRPPHKSKKAYYTGWKLLLARLVKVRYQNATCWFKSPETFVGGKKRKKRCHIYLKENVLFTWFFVPVVRCGLHTKILGKLIVTNMKL